MVDGSPDEFNLVTKNFHLYFLYCKGFFSVFLFLMAVLSEKADSMKITHKGLALQLCMCAYVSVYVYKQHIASLEN